MVTYRDIDIERIGQTCVRLETPRETVVYTNPWSGALDSAPEDGDVIFITNGDFDHTDSAGIDAVAADSSTIVVSGGIEANTRGRDTVRLTAEGVTVGGLRAEAVWPSQRRQDPPSEGSQREEVPTESALGLFLTIEDTTVYLPGDPGIYDRETVSQADVLVPPVCPSLDASDDAISEVARDEGPEIVLPVQYRVMKTIRDMVQELDELKSGQEAVRSRLDDRDAVMADLERKLDVLAEDLASLENRSATVEEESRPLPEAIERLDTLIAGAAAEDEVADQVDRLKARLETVKSTHESDIADVESTVGGLETELANEKETIRADSKEIEALKDRMSDLATEQRSDIADLESEVEEIRERQVSIDGESMQLPTAIRQVSTDLTELEERASTESDLREDLEAVRSDLATVITYMSQLSELLGDTDTDARDGDIATGEQRLGTRESRMGGHSVADIHDRLDELIEVLRRHDSPVGESDGSRPNVPSDMVTVVEPTPGGADLQASLERLAEVREEPHAEGTDRNPSLRRLSDELSQLRVAMN